MWLGVGGWLFVGTVAGRRRGWFWPLSLLGIGAVMLLQDVDAIRDFSLWPVLIIGLGASMVLEAASFRRSGDDDDSTTITWRDV